MPDPDSGLLKSSPLGTRGVEEPFVILGSAPVPARGVIPRVVLLTGLGPAQPHRQIRAPRSRPRPTTTPRAQLQPPKRQARIKHPPTKTLTTADAASQPRTRQRGLQPTDNPRLKATAGADCGAAPADPPANAAQREGGRANAADRPIRAARNALTSQLRYGAAARPSPQEAPPRTTPHCGASLSPYRTLPPPSPSPVWGNSSVWAFRGDGLRRRSLADDS